MYWSYIIGGLAVLLIYRWIQLKQSIRNPKPKDYWEDDWGPRPGQTTFWDKIRNFFKP